MADQFVPITAGSGTKIDTSELTVGANTVERQRNNVADPTDAAGLQKVINTAPAGTEYGSVVRPIVADTTASGALGALNAAVSVAMAGLNSASITLPAGNNLVGTLVGESSSDGTATWQATVIRSAAYTGMWSASVAVSSTNAAYNIQVPGGASHVRVRVSVYTSGIATAGVRATLQDESQPDPIVSGPDLNAAVPTKGPLVMAGWDGTNVRTLKTDSSGVLQMALSTAFTGITGVATKAQIPAVTMFTDASQVMSSGTAIDMDTARAKYWGGAPVFDASKYAGVDWCAKVLAVYSDAAYIASGKAIIDARGLTGSQTCATGSTALSTTKPTHWILGQMTLSLPTSGVSFLDINGVQPSIAAPSAPTLATSTTGGSLGATTAFGVKVTLVNLTGETLPSAEATITTGAGAVNIITVTSPTVGVGASVQCYNVYSATPIGSGWKLNNTSGPVPLGTSYVIKVVGAGAIPPTTGSAWEGMFELEGQGDSTVISIDSVNSPLLISSNNVYVHGLKFVSSQTANNNGSLWIDSSKDVWADHITCAGGGNCVYVNASSRVNVSNIRFGNPTVSGSAVLSTTSSNLKISNVTVTNSVWPSGTNLQGAVILSGCTDCSINGVVAKSLDISNLTDGAAVAVLGASLRTNINDVNCDSLVNADCVAILGMSLDTNISNVNCFNTAVGPGAGVGSNFNNGDCIDLFSAGRVNITNVISQSMGLIGGNRFPSFEFFDSSEVSATNIASYDSSGEGVKLFGCTGCSITNSHFNRNGKSGILLVDSATVVTCNNTTTITYVSGNGFGPWPAGTTVNIGAGPTAFQLASSPTSTTTAVLTAACNLGASQAFTVFTQDTQLIGNQTDDNGTGLQGTNAQSGIDILGSSQVFISGGSANDNRITASKTQQFGINSTGAASSFSAVNFDPSANLGGTCTNEIGPATAGNHWICDQAKTCTFMLKNGATQAWLISASETTGPGNKTGQASIVADSAAINTTETLIVKGAAIQGGRLVVGSVIRVVMEGTCTSTVGNTSTFAIRIGTAGTTSDGIVFSGVTGVAATTGTANPFRAVLEMTIRTVGASATATGVLTLENNGVTGISVTNTNIILPTMSAFNSTTAANIISATYKSAATTTTSTFKQAFIEVVYQ